MSIFAQLGEKLLYQIQTFYQTKKNIAGAQVDDRWREREGKLSQAVRLDISLYLSRANEPCIHSEIKGTLQIIPRLYPGLLAKIRARETTGAAFLQLTSKNKL